MPLRHAEARGKRCAMPNDVIEVSILRDSWPEISDWRMTPMVQGANNLILRVGDPAAPTAYVLRVYRNHADQRRLRHELGVMSAVSAMSLPFLIPAPIPTATGDLWRATPLDRATEALVTLWPLVPGAHPQRGDLAQARAAGQALATLDCGLALVSQPIHPQGDAPPPMIERACGILAGVDLPAILRRLPLSAGTAKRILALMEAVAEQAPVVYDSLPHQLIHSDYDPSNVLMDGSHVTGILDFEFSTVDPRVAELGAPLMWWPIAVFGTGAEWPIINSFGCGYVSVLPLAPEEIAALPLMLRIRYVGSMMHRVTRYIGGLTSAEELAQRFESTVARDDWLTENAARLVDDARTWG